MEIFQTVKSVRLFLSKWASNETSIGFVPTMGALHDGHISLINKAKQENDIVVCSIFVNPAQFNKKDDLTNYPRTPDTDKKLLEDAGCHCLFEPTVNEIYPDNFISLTENIEFGDLEKVMEGKFRPGHFVGVAKVVSRLFDIIQPTNAYFGEKDFQQLAIIRKLNQLLGNNIKIVGCPTLRTASGLAMSSRNIHLNAEELLASPVIYETLQMTADLIRKNGVEMARQIMTDHIEKFANFKVEYLEFVDAETLQTIKEYDKTKKQRACIAVLTSKTRLIDNIAF